MKHFIKIALIGGPACGKSSCLQELKSIPQANSSVLFIEESATSIIEKLPRLRENPFVFQSTVLAAQLTIEAALEKAIETTPSSAVVITDRGAYDAFVYADKICNFTGWFPSSEYDLVLFLHQPSMFHGRNNNPHRIESASEASELALKTYSVWKQFISPNNFIEIPAKDSVSEKARLIAATINAHFGETIFDLQRREEG